MPLNVKLAREQWVRYVYSRDTGHRLYIAKANRCEDFVAGFQWDQTVINEMRAVRRPTLTINKVLITLMSILGEQIDTRSEIAFQPRYNAPPQNAEILTKTFRFISDENQLDYLRSEVFADGCITSRGYYDVRLKFDHNTAGEVAIARLNPRTVIPDPDGSDYDPETWNDVITTTWVTADEIEVMYNKRDADALRARGESVWAHGYDSIDTGNDRFGGSIFAHMNMTEDMRSTMRGLRLIDRQYRKLTKMKYFVDPISGDKMRVPDEWDEKTVDYACQAGGLIVTEEVGKRIRWTVSCEDFILHDDWSPFRRFTVVPYFPVFRYGRTIGLVENLIDPQELLNKSLSQELHIVNTMANSGWIVKKNKLVNMTLDELESEGAKTGLILEVADDVEKDIQKIQPNQIPQGLDRLSFKAEGYIKTISGRGDAQLGLARSDVSADAIDTQKQSSDVNLRKALDNLQRTDHLLALSVLDLVQHYYRDKRIMHIVADDLTGASEAVAINVPDLASGEILNDLSLGSYSVTITSQNQRRTLEESQHVQALGLLKEGVPIPPRFLVKNSTLLDKGDIIKAMDEAEKSPEAQLKRQVEELGAKLTLANLKGEASKLEAEAGLRRAKTVHTMAQAANESKGEPGAEAEMAMKAKEHEQKMAMSAQEHEQKMQQEREKFALEQQMKKQDAFERRKNERIKAVAAASAAANQPAAKAPQGASA